MNALRLNITLTRAENLEAALSALTNIIGDTSYPQDARRAAQIAHKYLHVCRDARTVAQMERAQGIEPQGRSDA